MDRNNPYFRQVQLLMRILPLVAKEEIFALKGGTAINLFVRDMPRLSVDIDLVYLPLDDRETAIKNVQEALIRIAQEIERTIPQSKIQRMDEKLKLIVRHERLNVKIECTPVLRGSVFPVVKQSVTERVEAEFGYAEINILAFHDLYAGKICAALDRQHPRDLFDIKLLLENEGLSEELRKTFLVYLISHPRPMSEVLRPTRIDIRPIFDNEFLSMTSNTITVEELENVREQLIKTIHSELTDKERQFLLSFKAKSPDWELLGLEGIDQLPAVKWKLINLQKMSPEKHTIALQALTAILEAKHL